MSKRRNGVDKAIDNLKDEIRVRECAIGALLVQRGDDVVPPRAVTRRPTRRRERPATLTLEPDGDKG
jgi:hypothetical protein